MKKINTKLNYEGKPVIYVEKCDKFQEKRWK